jgi:acetylornithine/N-succinyldiaminopimelate aminotransferase
MMSHVLWYPGHDLLLGDIVRAENCKLYDSVGREYVDLESGVWCTSIGHGNPRVLRAISEQSARMSHAGFCYSSGVVERAAMEVLSLLGLDGGKCVFLCSGSEAVEYGVRVAKQLLLHPMLMTMADSYFGAYGSASIRSEGEWFCFDWFQCSACPNSGDCDESCEHWAAIPYDRIGGFLLEPGSSSGLVRFPPGKLIRNIVRTIKESDGLVLVNEVTTGVGRTGAWFGHQHYDLTPDIVAMGKGIGNGYPVAVTALGPSVAQRLGDSEVKYAQSHQHDPLGAAVVLEVISAIREEGLIERGREIASVLVEGLERIKARTGRIKEIRARGLMIALELIDDSETSLTVRTHRGLADRGFVLCRRPGTSVLRIDPSLTIDVEDITRFLEALEDALGSDIY